MNNRAALAHIDQRPPDHNLYCYRPGGDLYAVLSSRQYRRLRRQGQLESYLDKQRANGVVITRDQGG